MTEIDKLYDENNNDLIYLFNETGEEIAFEQIAVIPIVDKVYAILKPVVPLKGLGEDEGLVFVVETEGENEYLALVVDEDVIDDVFKIYDMIIEENEGE